MKKIKLLLVVSLLGIAATASAQFANSAGSSYGFGNWQSIKVSYLPASFDGDGADIDFNGAMVSYLRGFGITEDVPLFIETGLGVSWIGGDFESIIGASIDATTGETDFYYTNIDLNFFSVNIPVNFGYRHAFNENCSIAPFVGITLRGNLFGNYKEDGESYNAFDKDEVGEGFQLKRFNIGWQVGVGLYLKSFYIGASYGKDFNEIVESGKAVVPKLTLGYSF